MVSPPPQHGSDVATPCQDRWVTPTTGRDFWCTAAAAALPGAHALRPHPLAEPTGVPLGYADGPAVVIIAACPFVALAPRLAPISLSTCKHDQIQSSYHLMPSDSLPCFGVLMDRIDH
jgi:hypothetical protein